MHDSFGDLSCFCNNAWTLLNKYVTIINFKTDHGTGKSDQNFFSFEFL